MAISGRLTDKIALITGAGSGFGRASALRFAAEGASVVCVDRNADAAHSAADDIAAAGGTALALTADVSSAADAERMTTTTLEHFGRIDIVFANAGIPGSGDAHTTTEEEWDRVIAINLKGVWLTSKYALPHMVERRSGVIINQASVGGLIGIPGIFPYAAAKGGVISMTRQMAAAYAPHNIRVNAICPGGVYTPLVELSRQKRGLTASSVEEANAIAARNYPLGRLGTVEEIASLALFLASDEAAWITGGIYPVDGGRGAVGTIPTD
ncbi:SDR family NAD(P)-dependent oxidoreductase [Thermobifida fusca]|uniref:SDR family NAD(P)-dependent oxidoreductase n=1 Tax=Thermobifida TaxID=83677 RepID=UPI00077CB485|nr:MULTISPECIES: SDR family NAD(P)-dependent oxidoreductase [Thermobifida]MBO2530979.1 NAD(P)-dependent oxidoreductase [Thermobifida sp.]PZN60039.1 MAG: SDR family NAD(P)-dependent oxidoreductase [Thermobifida fusca]QOS58069.1 SDR family oxidoreductase [Thermobifida fusca]